MVCCYIGVDKWCVAILGVGKGVLLYWGVGKGCVAILGVG